MKAKKNYLITGGFGFIGSELIKKLNGNITVLTRNKKSNYSYNNKVKVIQKNITGILEKDVRGADIIYHLASTVDNYNALTNPFLDVNTNINGTIQLLESCKNLKKKPKIIYLSTFFVYGNEYDKTKKPINEESKTEPLGLYPITKLASEEIIKFYSNLYQIPYLICRLTNVYGENESGFNNKKAGLNYILMQIANNKEVKLYNGGNFYRDYIHVEDVVNALLFLEDRVKNELFLIGSGKKILFKDLIKLAINFSNSKSKIVNVTPPDFHKIVGINNFVADTSKINDLGWKPEINYKVGIKKIIKKYKSLI